MPFVNLLVLLVYFRMAFLFVLYFRTLPNVVLPGDINEKMFWRKVFDHNPDFTTFCDKLAVKDYVKKLMPDLACAKVYWRGRDVRQAPDSAFEHPTMFKPNHTAGRFMRLPAGVPDREALQKRADEWLKYRHVSHYDEWGYRNVVPELFLEERIDKPGMDELLDINLYTYGDKVGLIIATLGEKTGNDRVGLFDADGTRLPAHRQLLPKRKKPVPLPEGFALPVKAAKLRDIAVKLTGGSDHLRIDLMWNGKQLYICEITVYAGGGFRVFSDPAIAEHMSALWDLKNSWFMTTPQSGWRGRYKAWLDRQLDARPTS
jgi:hypothetical protein